MMNPPEQFIHLTKALTTLKTLTKFSIRQNHNMPLTNGKGTQPI